MLHVNFENSFCTIQKSPRKKMPLAWDHRQSSATFFFCWCYLRSIVTILKVISECSDLIWGKWIEELNSDKMTISTHLLHKIIIWCSYIVVFKALVENNEIRIEKNNGSGHIPLVFLSILAHSSHVRDALFYILPRSWARQ